MLRMIGYGDMAGSGFPTILAAWAEKGWPEPELEEDMILNQATLTLRLESTQSLISLPIGNSIGNDGFGNLPSHRYGVSD